MRRIVLPRIGTVAAWRAEARRLASAGVPAEAVLWQVGDGARDLFEEGGGEDAGAGTAVRLSRTALASIETALCHRDPERFARAYALVLGLSRGELVWGDRADPAMNRVLAQEKAVRRDIHKMHAFVRFREIGDRDALRRTFAAWFEPEHLITEAAAPFFARRFGDMDWIIATPDLTARFTNRAVAFSVTDGATRPPPDASEELWRTYFAHIFNPARLMVSAMTSEMPRKYWKNLPEAELIPEMIRSAPARARTMQEAAATMPDTRAARLAARRVGPAGTSEGDMTLPGLKARLDACRRCPIGACATQAAAGEGPENARLMIVGEQPGDEEDLAGRPFLGPAGRVFDDCARAAGLDRSEAYITNAVKHFKFAPRGKKRLHQRPSPAEVEQCRWWLDLERALVRPRAILALGSTAALALTGDGRDLSHRRGQIERDRNGTPMILSWHPAFLLRAPEKSTRDAVREELIAHMRLAMNLAGAT